MRCRVVYRIAQRPRWWTRASIGVLSIDDAGLRIDGPVLYRAAFSEIHWLNVTNRAGLFYIAISSEPPVFVTPFVFSLLGVIRVIHPPLNQTLYAELQRRVGGLSRCADCGCDVRLSAVPCPQCAAGGSRVSRSRGRLRLLVACALALLLALYVGSYYRLSRRGMREAKDYNMKGFLYVPAKEVFQTRDLTRHYARVQLFAPLNWTDRVLFGAPGPARCILWGLSK
jgi:hypothetical protein